MDGEQMLSEWRMDGERKLINAVHEILKTEEQCMCALQTGES